MNVEFGKRKQDIKMKRMIPKVRVSPPRNEVAKKDT
jgi:hypothetical protein